MISFELPPALDQVALRFPRLTAWVVGDVILDIYIRGSAERISPEAPVPVIRMEERRPHLGGAANTAANCAALGAHVTLFGVMGADAARDEVEQLGREAGITLHCITDPSRPTTTKTRFGVGTQQLLRLDHEVAQPLAPAVEQALLETLAMAPAPDVVIVSDYAKGCITEAVIKQLSRLKPGTLLVADPKRSDLSFYRGCDFIKPNLIEAARAAGCSPARVMEEGPLQRLREAVGGVGVLITRGRHGMVLLHPDGEKLVVETRSREVFDVTGAGDTVAAAFSLALAAGASPLEAVHLANAAGGVAVSRIGTHAVSLAELCQAVQHSFEEHKLLSLEVAEQYCAAARQQGRRIVFTNGCFDVLHAGHVHLLSQARRMGDLLLLGLNSDASIRQLKGPNRPVVSLSDRAAVLSALSCVDRIVVFEEDTPRELVARLKPDVLVKGDDYTPDQIAGADLVKSWGGRVQIVQRLEGRSTTSMLKQAMGASASAVGGSFPSS